MVLLISFPLVKQTSSALTNVPSLCLKRDNHRGEADAAALTKQLPADLNIQRMRTYRAGWKCSYYFSEQLVFLEWDWKSARALSEE